jgi:hypothetical protein
VTFAAWALAEAALVASFFARVRVPLAAERDGALAAVRVLVRVPVERELERVPAVRVFDRVAAERVVLRLEVDLRAVVLLRGVLLRAVDLLAVVLVVLVLVSAI